jgi:hypothetical protein
MPKLNHERLHAKLRVVAADARHRDAQQEREQSDYVWYELPFGRHKGKTLPWIILNDPSYFYWLITENILTGSLERQAAIIAQRAAHILPPPEYRDKVFRIVLNDFGDLVGFDFTKTRQKSSAVRYATPHLNLKIILTNVGWPTTAGALLLNSFRRYYFRGPSSDWPAFCDAFFRDDENFSLICTGDHSSIPRCRRLKRRKHSRKDRESSGLDCSVIQV